MSKTVRLQNNIVVEIIPEYSLPVAKWYGPDFAAQCVEAPDEVEQGWAYDPTTGKFGLPGPEPASESTTEETLLELAADWEYRLCMIELGLN